MTDFFEKIKTLIYEHLVQLAKTLSSIEQIKKDKDEANLKIRFVKRKMEEQSSQK